MGKWLDRPLQTLTFEVRDAIAYITFSRPEKRNALNAQSMLELNRALLEADDLKAVRCIVLAGEGKDFCAGADIEKVYGADAASEDYRSRSSFDDDTWALERASDLRLIVHKIHKPVIAKVQGHCLAVGSDIALNCDLIIVADDAKIGFPATRSLGSPANHMWLYHVGPQWAKRMLMTGDLLLGKDAERIGLVLKSVPADRLDEEVDALARRITLVDAELQATHKRIVNLGLELMGRDTLQRLAVENDARAHLTGAFKDFNEDLATLGLKGALKKRDEPFGSSIVLFED